MSLHSLLTLLVAASWFCPCLSQAGPNHARNLTVYHVNPASAGAVPVNMDTGDALGDLYFYLGEFLLPLECKNASKEFRAHFDCDNPERVDPNLVVTKVDMQVDSRSTVYSACNLCNGTDPFTRRPCKVGSYVCDCENWQNKSKVCNPTKVGEESIKDHFTPHDTTPMCAAALNKTCGRVRASEHLCGNCVYEHQKDLENASCVAGDFMNFCPSRWSQCNATSPEWMCWGQNIPRKTGGYWYSTLQKGMCTNTSSPGSCGWKVWSTQTIRETCLKDKLMTRVEAASPSCFASCGARNPNSSCWITCFFDTLLGPQARHSASVPLSGLSSSEIEKAWTDAFLSEKHGGCPTVDIPYSWLPGPEMVLI